MVIYGHLSSCGVFQNGLGEAQFVLALFKIAVGFALKYGFRKKKFSLLPTVHAHAEFDEFVFCTPHKVDFVTEDIRVVCRVHWHRVGAVPFPRSASKHIDHFVVLLNVDYTAFVGFLLFARQKCCSSS